MIKQIYKHKGWTAAKAQYSNDGLKVKLPVDLKKHLAINRNLNVTYMLKEQFRTIFTQKSENAAIWELSRWIRLALKSGIGHVKRFALGIAKKFNEVINGIRYIINSGRIESANAGIKRIQSKSCGLFDIEYLFMKMRQIYLAKHVPYLQRKVAPLV